MMKNRVTAVLLWLGVVLVAAQAATAQDASAQKAASEQQQAEEKVLKEKAAALLEQVISEAQGLKLPENRARIQIIGGDLLWERNEARARTLFANAAAAISDMILRGSAGDNRQNFEMSQALTPLRRELLTRVARHDASLAYQFLQATRPPATTANASARGNRGFDAEDYLEQMLLLQIAASDPKAAVKYAEEMMDKGQYPGNIMTILARLQRQDREAAAKFSDKLAARLQAENLTANRDAINLVFMLLQAGPRAASATGSETQATPQSSLQVLSESAYRDLLESVVASALKATPSSAAARGNARVQRGVPQPAGSAQSDAQIEQVNARMLLIRMQLLLSNIDKYLPERAQAIRQKLSDVGMNTTPRADVGQMNGLVQMNTSESLAAAAATAPVPMQPRLYQQAALRAVEEGNTERAIEIANQHLDAATRESVLQRVSFKQLAIKAQTEKIDEVRQALLNLPTDAERLTLLLQLVAATQKDNQKLALQFLSEARGLVTRRASNYQQLEDQLRVAHAYASLDAARSFEILEPGINQLNELLPAAAMLSGFDVYIFRDGELPMEGGSALANMVTRYGQELSYLSKSNFERSLVAADKFQLAESRILARLAIVQGVLGQAPSQSLDNNPGQRVPFTRRRQ